MTDPFADLSPEQSTRLQELRQALQQEFEVKEDAKKAAIKEVVDLKEDSLEALRHTVRFSTNESLKAKVSMWVLDTILDAQKAEDETGILGFLKGLEEVKSASGS